MNNKNKSVNYIIIIWNIFLKYIEYLKINYVIYHQLYILFIKHFEATLLNIFFVLKLVL